MKTRKHCFVILAAVAAGSALAQHTVPNTWTNLIGASQGWPQERSGRAIHLVQTPPVNPAMGQLGTIHFWGRNNPGESFVRTHTWLPPMAWETGNGTFGRAGGDPLDYEAFCCGQALMMDGKIAIAGSNFRALPGLDKPGPEVAVYNPATNTWTKSPPEFQLTRDRYYPSVTRMPNGNIVVTGGQAIEWEEGQLPEVTWGTDKPFETNSNTGTLLTAWSVPNENDHWFVNYPFVFPVSETQLFFAGPTSRNVVTQGGIDTKYPTFLFSTMPSDSGPSLFGGHSETFYGSVVMYRPGKILKSGGVANLDAGHNYEHLPATNQCEIIDVGNLNARPSWQFVQPLNTARIDHNMVVLPNGKVMALGGSTQHHEPDPPNSHRVISCEIWDPATNTWSYTANPADLFRGYHSTAILLPDGRVLSAGGDAGYDEEVDAPSGQIYLPDYGIGTRPKILTAPNELPVGGEITITVDDWTVNKAVLVGLGAVTHSFDMNQRYVEVDLSTNIGTPTIKSIAGPVSTTQAPYGWYMLFVLKPDGNGNMLPCQMAKYIKVVPPTPN